MLTLPHYHSTNAKYMSPQNDKQAKNLQNGKNEVPKSDLTATWPRTLCPVCAEGRRPPPILSPDLAFCLIFVTLSLDKCKIIPFVSEMLIAYQIKIKFFHPMTFSF